MWTTQQAYDWIMREVPRGSKVTMESRQILLPPAYQATYVAQLRLHSFEDYDAQGIDYLVASSQSYGNYLDVKNDGPQKYPSEYADYQRIFWKAREVARFTPSDEDCTRVLDQAEHIVRITVPPQLDAPPPTARVPAPAGGGA